MAKASPKKGQTEAQKKKAKADPCPDLCTICEDQLKGQLLMCDGAGNVVLTPAPTANGQTLTWDATAGTWVASNVPPPPGMNRTPGAKPATDPDNGPDETNPWAGKPPGTMLYADGIGGFLPLLPPPDDMVAPIIAWVDGKPAWTSARGA